MLFIVDKTRSCENKSIFWKTNRQSTVKIQTKSIVIPKNLSQYNFLLKKRNKEAKINAIIRDDRHKVYVSNVGGGVASLRGFVSPTPRTCRSHVCSVW